MEWIYQGKPCAADPSIAIRETCTLGERVEAEGDWWYRGHPCDAYVAGTNHLGLACSAVAEFDDFCGPCRVVLSEAIKALEAGAVDTIHQILETIE